ncbi:hypothetical protein BDV19DRAFT_363077 [Aspergillus venezuelensis]
MSSQGSSQHGSTSRVGKRRAAPYGQACLHCFKTKSKCVRQGNDDTCERCTRLNKQCTSADSLRKRSSQKPSDSAAEIAKLKAENDTLNELLQRLPSISVADGSGPPMVIRDPVKGPEAMGKKAAIPDPSATSATSSDWRLHPNQEQLRLSIFREQKLPFLPFIRLHLDTTAQSLREEKPFLFKAIMACTSSSILERRARSTELREALARKTMGGIEASLDLLLSVLTYLAWGYDSFIHDFGTTGPSRLTQIAMAVAHDLRFTLSRPKNSLLFSKEVMNTPNATGTKTPEEPVPQILDTKRAILGCFLMSSLTANHYQRFEPMRWTPQLEEYLSALRRSKECPTDEMFSLLVRLQVLIQQVSEQREQRELERCQGAAASIGPASTEPVLNRLYLEALQKKLQDIVNTIPPHLKTHEILLSQLHYTSFSIYQTIFPVNAIDSNPPAFGVSATLDEQDCHYHILQTIRSFFENFSKFSSREWAGFPLPMFVQSIRCTAVLLRLSTPITHRAKVRNIVDVLHVVDWVSERIRGAAIELGEESPKDLYGILLGVSINMRTHVARIVEPPPPPEQQPTTTAPFAGTPSMYNSGSDSGVDIGTDPMAIQQWMMFEQMLGIDQTYNEPLASLQYYGGAPMFYGYTNQM